MILIVFSEVGNCCIGLLLCALALIDKKRWEKVTAGAADLFDEGPLGSQVIASSILDCVGGSNKSLFSLFPSESAKEKSALRPSKEQRRIAALADCKSTQYEGFWISSCTKTVREFEKEAEEKLRRTHCSGDIEQRLRIVKHLSSSPSKMMTVEEVTDAIGIVTYQKALAFRKHLKRSFLTGSNALPVYIKDSPKGTEPSLRKELTLVILKQDSEKSAFERAALIQNKIAQKFSRHTLDPNFSEMKQSFKLFEDEKSKMIGKAILKSAGFSDSNLRKHLNFSKKSMERATDKVSAAKTVLPEMWRKAFDMVRSRYPGRSDSKLLPKAKLVMKKLCASKLLAREKSELAHRPRMDFDPKILETIVEISATSSDSGHLTHSKRHYDVKYIASVKESVETNKKLSAGRLREHYNLIARETGMPTASISTVKRRCLAPHSGHNNSRHYFNEAKIKFGKVPDTGTSIPSVNIQYCRAFAKMEQRRPFRFDERFPHLREYSTINSTDAKAPVILGSKNSFKVGRSWMSYVSEDDRWSPLQEKDEVSSDCTKRDKAVDDKVVPLQALPCHDYHSGRDVIVPNTNLFIEKTFSVDSHSGRESVCWSGTKLAVIVSPKFEYSSGALTHVNERYQLRRFGDEEVKMKMTLAHTDVPSVSLRYLLGEILSWLQSVKGKDNLKNYVTDVDATEASKLSTFLRSLSRRLIQVPTPPLSLIPIYEKNPSQMLEKLLHTLQKERLQQLSIQVNDLATGTEQEAYELMLAMKNALTQDGLEECAFEVENVGRIKFINAFQRVIDHVIIRTSGFPLNELGTSYVTLDGLSCLQRTTKLMDDFSIGPNANKEMVYLREMNGASLMLEIAERLELSEDLFLEDNIDQASASSLDVIELLSSYECLADGREIYLACEPRPFNYRLVDGGPDQKQSNLATKIAAAIEFRMELNAHACIQRRAERDSVANEAERGNSMLGRAASIGSSISNTTFKTAEDCITKLEGDLQERSVDQDEIKKIKSIATSLGDEFLAEMNMWYGAKELASRWNGFPCFGKTIFAKTPLSFYQLPLSHLLEADIQAYCKASREDKETSERFDWIRQNLKWYDQHAQISTSGYYEERRACGDTNCCGTRMLPLGVPQTPKPSTTNIKHYENSRLVQELLNDEEALEIRLAGLNLFAEIPVDEERYRQMDYFLPSNALEVVFTHRHGLTEKDMEDFQKVFPCPEESLKEEVRKHLEKEKAKERQKLPISLNEKLSPDKLHSERIPRLTETLREICSCCNVVCPWRVTGVKYDLVSRIMEHSTKCQVIVGREIEKMNRVSVEKELRDVHSLPTSGSTKDVKERLARAREKKWLPPKPSQEAQSTAQSNTGLTEDFLLLSSVINTVIESS